MTTGAGDRPDQALWLASGSDEDELRSNTESPRLDWLPRGDANLPLSAALSPPSRPRTAEATGVSTPADGDGTSPRPPSLPPPPSLSPLSSIEPSSSLSDEPRSSRACRPLLSSILRRSSAT